MELWSKKIVEKTVYINCIGFLKICDPHRRNGDLDYYGDCDVLDATRIHPENYLLAKKIAKDALDEDEDIDHDREEPVIRIMKNP